MLDFALVPNKDINSEDGANKPDAACNDGQASAKSRVAFVSAHFGSRGIVRTQVSFFA